MPQALLNFLPTQTSGLEWQEETWQKETSITEGEIQWNRTQEKGEVL